MRAHALCRCVDSVGILDSVGISFLSSITYKIEQQICILPRNKSLKDILCLHGVEPESDCPELLQLRTMYANAIRAYRDVIAILDHVSTDREFEQAYERAEAARLLFIRARFNLLYHIQEHGCVAPAEEDAASAS